MFSAHMYSYCLERYGSHYRMSTNRQQNSFAASSLVSMQLGPRRYCIFVSVVVVFFGYLIRKCRRAHFAVCGRTCINTCLSLSGCRFAFRTGQNPNRKSKLLTPGGADPTHVSRPATARGRQCLVRQTIHPRAVRI